MRINVYAEEVTADTELVTKTVTDDKFGTRTFYGVRVYLKSPPELHADPADDDRSAITFWVPWTRARGHDFEPVRQVLFGLAEALGRAKDAEALSPAPHSLHAPVVPESDLP
jgi:hypothetical protein